MIFWDGYIYFGTWTLIDISFKRRTHNLSETKSKYTL